MTKAISEQFKAVIENAANEMKKLNKMEANTANAEKIDHNNLIVINFHRKEKKEAKTIKKEENVRFLMYKVVKGEKSCKVWYSYSNYEHKGVQKEYIKIYEEGYSNNLNEIFPNVVNNSDSMTDYFEKSRVTIEKDSPYWEKAFEMVEKHNEKNRKRHEKRMAKYKQA